MKFSKSATISLITVFVVVILTIIIVPICVVHACPSKSAPIEAKKLQSEPYDPNKNINNNFYGKNLQSDKAKHVFFKKHNFAEIKYLTKIQEWYFVTKMVLTFYEKKLF